MSGESPQIDTLPVFALSALPFPTTNRPGRHLLGTCCAIAESAMAVGILGLRLCGDTVTNHL